MKRSLWMMALALAACGKKEPAPAPAPTAPTATAAPTPTTAAPTATADAGATTAPEADAAAAPADAAATAPTAGTSCVPADVMDPLGKIVPDFAALKDATTTVCGTFDSTTGWCFTMDLAAQRVTGAKLPEDDLAHVANGVGAINDSFVRKEDAPALQLCLDAKTGCKDAYVGQAIAAFLTEDKKRFVLTTLDDREKRVRVFDTATLSETASVVVEKEADLPDCTFGALVGDALLIATGPCGEGSARHAWLADATSGDKRFDLGGTPDFDVRYDGFVRVKDDLWAFRSGDGSKVVVQDVKTGAVKSTVDLSAAGAKKSVRAWLFVVPEPLELVVVENRPTTGATYAFDPMTGQPTRSLVPKACP
ncbi:MAG: hypothetical protein U1F43_29680 [Myxococcota bacterium]